MISECVLSCYNLYGLFNSLNYLEIGRNMMYNP